MRTVACAAVRAQRVDTLGVRVAFGGAGLALVDVLALFAVALEAGPACARVCTLVVLTLGVLVARVAGRTFVDIDADLPLLAEALVTAALVGAGGVGTRGVFGTGLLDNAFVRIHALIVHHQVAQLATALEASRRVGARLFAVVCVLFALVNVHTPLLVSLGPLEAIKTLAVVVAIVVHTHGVHTLVRLQRAFIDVLAFHPVAFVAAAALAREAAHLVEALGVLVTVVPVVGAFVFVMTNVTGAAESHFAFACVSTSRVEASRIGVTFVRKLFVRALIDIYAFIVDAPMSGCTVALLLLCLLVNLAFDFVIGAMEPIPQVALFAFAVVITGRVRAEALVRTFVVARLRAFVDINAFASLGFDVSWLALALVAAGCVDAVVFNAADVARTLVHVYALTFDLAVAGLAVAVEAGHVVDTNLILATRVLEVLVGALVDILAFIGCCILDSATSAVAHVARRAVLTFRHLLVAVVLASFTLIDVLASPVEHPVAGVAEAGVAVGGAFELATRMITANAGVLLARVDWIATAVTVASITGHAPASVETWLVHTDGVVSA